MSDRIRRVSGKAYDVYRDIFLERVRESIRAELLAGRGSMARLFGESSANEAEDSVYHFLAAHYDDPFMDWEGSAERRRVESLGFSLPSVDPIIASFYARLGERR